VSKALGHGGGVGGPAVAGVGVMGSEDASIVSSSCAGVGGDRGSSASNVGSIRGESQAAATEMIMVKLMLPAMKVV
jgi:hypothetical protein